MKARLAVFASGTGSNFVSIAKAVEAGQVEADLALLFCDNPQAGVLDRATELGIPAVAFSPADCESRTDYEQRLCTLLSDYRIDLVALAGYMRIIGAPLLVSHANKILNIHPSLLPDFPGRDSIAEAHKAGVAQTGVTIHYIDEGIDTGPVIAQEAVHVSPGEPLSVLEERIHEVEHRLYPSVLQRVISGFKEA